MRWPYRPRRASRRQLLAIIRRQHEHSKSIMVDLLQLRAEVAKMEAEANACWFCNEPIPKVSKAKAPTQLPTVYIVTGLAFIDGTHYPWKAALPLHTGCKEQWDRDKRLDAAGVIDAIRGEPV